MRINLGKVFSIKREGMNKVFTILGIKIKLPVYTNCYLPDNKMLAQQNIDFPHPIGIVIAKNATLGKNCKIYQNVTIAGKGGGAAHIKENFPTLGDNVVVYAGACIIGGVKIGDNAIIGANAVVVKDVPANCVVAGNPAKIIRKIDGPIS